MITIPEAKRFVDALVIQELERVSKILTVADLGLKAKPADVTKVKALIQARILKLRPLYQEPPLAHLDTKRIP